ncbi:interferon regulatory factor 7 isoform X2 [Ambystoma mexicanum]|uniref:interferon regulatory factor 7 isoform X2 n=1 Tax=Ambystoma mexicanum TaxID=8296 RepID=UPI0037E7132B
MGGGNRAHHKELFGPWLIRQINNNRYGLSWRNPEKTVFHIPWKHFSRKDINGQDYELFKAWAIHGGKYSEQNEDRSTWKTNFRCALNSVSVKEKREGHETQDGATVNGKTMFIEVDDRSKEPHDPHKVYRLVQFLESPNHKSAAPWNNRDGLPDSEEDEDLSISPDSLQIPDFKMARSQLDQASIEEILQILSLENPDAENGPLGHNVIPNGHCLENGFHADESGAVMYDARHTQKNGYLHIQPTTVQWCQMEKSNPAFNGCVYQQQPWVLLTAPHTPASQTTYNTHLSIPNDYASAVELGNGVQYATQNSPVENSYQPWASEWAQQPAVAQHSPIQNGFTSPASAFQHGNSPQHQIAPFSANNQHQLGAATAYNTHNGGHNGYVQEVPPGNGASYCATNHPVEDSYHTARSQPIQTGYGFQQESAQPCPQPPIAEPTQHHSHSNATPSISNLDVTIYYKGTEVHRQEVNRRCLLSFMPEDPSLGQLEAVRFPSPNNMHDQKQLDYTNRLLNSVQGGLLLDVHPTEKKLFAKRLGKCKVFWAFSEELANMSHGTESRMLQRETPTEIFNFHTFLTELKDYRNLMRSSPDYHIYLCFGQCLTEKPKERKLILVKIVPRFCSFLHEVVQGEGASSLNSETVSLQISNGSSISLFDLLDSANLMDIDLPC